MGEIIIALLIMWPIGYFLALLVTGGIRDHWWAKLLQAALGLAIGALFLFLLYAEAKEDAREYNNGICTVCGGEYHFSGAAGRMSRSYYYTCDSCDHTIRTESIMN